MDQLEERLWKLEKLFFPINTVPGTAISRVSLAHTLFKKEGIKLEVPFNKNSSSVVWCLALGPMSMPKDFFYGNTIKEAVERAERKLL